MPTNSNRLVRINEEILRELSTLLRQVKDPRIQGPMISVLRCDVTNDLRWCKVYLTVLGEFDEKELRMGLKSCAGFLRRELAHRLTLRYTPELTFILDESIAHSAHIAEVLNKLDIQHDENEGGDADGTV